MKRLTTMLCALVVILTLFISSIYAQEEEESADKNKGNEKKVRVGTKGGFNLVTTGGEQPPSDGVPLKSRMCNSGGLYVTIPVHDFIAIQPEAFWNQKGARLETGSAAYETLNIDYIEIALLFKLYMAGGKVRPNIFAGPYYAHNISYKYVATTLNDSQEVPQDETQLVKGQYGIIAGGGFEFGKISIECWYEMGASNTFDSEHKDVKPYNWKSTFKNKVVSFKLGYGF